MFEMKPVIYTAEFKDSSVNLAKPAKQQIAQTARELRVNGILFTPGREKPFNYNVKTKLSNTEAPTEKSRENFEIPDKILMTNQHKFQATSFSLRPNDQNRFNFLLKRV